MAVNGSGEPAQWSEPSANALTMAARKDLDRLVVTRRISGA